MPNLTNSFVMTRDTRSHAIRPASLLQVRYRAVTKAAFVYGLSRWMKVPVVTEFPKSGGTWLSQMLASYLGLPFFRNNHAQSFRRSVLHGHFRYSPLIGNPVVVWRDGRDVMVSAYYHYLFHNEVNLASAVIRKREELNFENFDDIRQNLPRFIKYLFEKKGSSAPRVSWSDFVDSWHGKSAIFVNYEDLLSKCEATLRRVLLELGAEEIDPERLRDVVQQFSWSKQTGRAAGSEVKSSFLRKGISGDWKNQFTADARLMFARHAGDRLIRLGYESNVHWVTQDTIQPCPLQQTER